MCDRVYTQLTIFCSLDELFHSVESIIGNAIKIQWQFEHKHKNRKTTVLFTEETQNRNTHLHLQIINLPHFLF